MAAFSGIEHNAERAAKAKGEKMAPENEENGAGRDTAVVQSGNEGEGIARWRGRVPAEKRARGRK